MSDLNYFSKYLSYDREKIQFRFKRKNPQEYERPSRIKSWNTRYAGSIAGSTHTSRNYYRRVYITVEGRKYLMHHLVLLFEGIINDLDDLQGMEVDHIDGNPVNNDPENLRIVTPSVNRRNSKRNIRNTSGFNGVYLRKDTGKWVAQIGGLESRVLGNFETYEEAVNARVEYNKLNDFTENHGVRSDD